MAEKMPPKPAKNVVKSPAVMKQVKTVQAAKKLPGYDLAREIKKDAPKIREKYGTTKETLRGRLADAAGDRASAMRIAEGGAMGIKQARTIAANSDMSKSKMSVKRQELQAKRMDKLAKAESDLKLATKARKIEEGRETRIKKSAQKESTRLFQEKFPRSGGGGAGGMGPGRGVVKQPRP